MARLEIQQLEEDEPGEMESGSEVRQKGPERP